ncbi:uncharacterized protein EV422DRAFT_509953 [Fimicolochytrium jonesii]|uniref:uncharacterized protein n=1 Tax=Fimicolochytrium jonesii TaxID=1396493 RepID=UPI0022FE8921|nr:uncharacterized protein EV422DRAFT_509953 [Fimicolochytrium jonesii]KAI8816221.1 hypothetical protein EV422DRAFT_509953 [Fimicolochytrium jonesii]
MSDNTPTADTDEPAPAEPATPSTGGASAERPRPLKRNPDYPALVLSLSRTFRAKGTASFHSFKTLWSTLLPNPSTLPPKSILALYSAAQHPQVNTLTRLYTLYYTYYNSKLDDKRLQYSRIPEKRGHVHVRLTPEAYADLHAFYEGCARRKMTEPVYMWNRMRGESAVWVVPFVFVEGVKEGEREGAKFGRGREKKGRGKLAATDQQLKELGGIAQGYAQPLLSAERASKLTQLLDQYESAKSGLPNLPTTTPLSQGIKVKSTLKDSTSEPATVLWHLEEAERNRAAMLTTMMLDDDFEDAEGSGSGSGSEEDDDRGDNIHPRKRLRKGAGG